jgi:hypothetical protein
MKTNELIPHDDKIKGFISENKILIATIGGVALGLAIASLTGNEKAREVLRSAGSTIVNLSEKFVGNLDGFKALITPLLGRTQAEGI